MAIFFGSDTKNEPWKSIFIILFLIFFLFAFEAIFFQIQTGSFLLGVLVYWIAGTADVVIDILVAIFKNAKEKTDG